MPPCGERGALVGLAVGAVVSFFLGGPIVRMLGTCVLAELAVGRALDHRVGIGGASG